MKWSFLRSLFLCLSFTTVTLALVENLNDDLEYDPQVTISCGKVTRHTNVDTGDWITDKNNISLCTGDKTEILKYCQTVYPSKNISNVVEANNRVLVDNSLVRPFRCLVGFFESDALLVPPQCRFEHVHENSECQSHDAWHKRATDKCGSETMILGDYGVLIPCGTGVFTGVEFVCCPSDAAQPATEAVKIVDVSHATAKPLSVLDHLKNEISKFAKNVEPSSVGCDRKKYHDRRDKLEETHRQRVEGLIKQWEQAEKRFKLLKVTDENQATASIAGELENFKSTLASYDDQVKLERNRLKEEHHQCTQIDLNNKKNQALGDFVAALQKEPRDGNKVLEAVQRYVKICTQDRLHNLRYFEYVQKHHPEKTDDARKSLQNHFKLINKLVNESMILLYKLPEIARQFQLDLPDWIPKLPALPTEKPTVAKTSAAKDPTDPPSNTEEHMELKTEVEKDEGASENKDEDPSVKGRKAGADDDEDDEDVTENEEGFFRRTHSQATFSAVIGLSCGALVIMIIIVVAMAMRRTRPNNNTKTVLVDADSDNATEKSHLVNMQENGYENPTYRFYDY